MRTILFIILTILHTQVAVASCDSGFYISGGSYCANNLGACPDEAIYSLVCSANSSSLTLVRPTKGAKSYGYQSGIVRFSGSGSNNGMNGTYQNFVPTRECGGTIKVPVNGQLTFDTSSAISIKHEKISYNVTKCKLAATKGTLRLTLNRISGPGLPIVTPDNCPDMVRARDNLLPVALENASQKGLSVSQLDSIIDLLNENEAMIQSLIDKGHSDHLQSSIARTINIVTSQISNTLSLGATSAIEELVKLSASITSNAVDCFMEATPVDNTCVNDALLSISIDEATGVSGGLITKVFTLYSKTKKLSETDQGYREQLVELKGMHMQVKRDLQASNILRENRLKDKATQAWINNFKERIDAICR